MANRSGYYGLQTGMAFANGMMQSYNKHVAMQADLSMFKYNVGRQQRADARADELLDIKKRGLALDAYGTAARMASNPMQGQAGQADLTARYKAYGDYLSGTGTPATTLPEGGKVAGPPSLENPIATRGVEIDLDRPSTPSTGGQTIQSFLAEGGPGSKVGQGLTDVKGIPKYVSGNTAYGLERNKQGFMQPDLSSATGMEFEDTVVPTEDTPTVSRLEERTKEVVGQQRWKRTIEDRIGFDKRVSEGTLDEGSPLPREIVNDLLKTGTASIDETFGAEEVNETGEVPGLYQEKLVEEAYNAVRKANIPLENKEALYNELDSRGYTDAKAIARRKTTQAIDATLGAKIDRMIDAPLRALSKPGSFAFNKMYGGISKFGSMFREDKSVNYQATEGFGDAGPLHDRELTDKQKGLAVTATMESIRESGLIEETAREVLKSNPKEVMAMLADEGVINRDLNITDSEKEAIAEWTVIKEVDKRAEEIVGDRFGEAWTSKVGKGITGIGAKVGEYANTSKLGDINEKAITGFRGFLDRVAPRKQDR